MAKTTTNILGLLQKIYGYQQFRPLQQEVIEQSMANNDALVVMPTGGGKSMCFQIPALAKAGIGVVVSPLIALMEDQVSSLQQLGVPAYSLNSSKTPEEIKDIVQKMEAGKLKLLYISPEKLMTNNFLNFLQSFSINLIAVDEAHCVSIWGNDFRPEYTKIKQIRKYFPDVPMMALTATADQTTQEDIKKQLNLVNPYFALGSFERKNIFLKVEPGIKRKERIINFLKSHRGESGIIYCLSRRQTESLADSLTKKGMRVGFYHAGMSAAERRKIQQSFINDELQIICATIAFGMGIDKSNIRWIIHYDLPKNVEGYYQEIGRAGRDGLPAEALLFQTYGTVTKLKQFIDDSSASPEFKQIQYEKLERMWRFAQTGSCRTNVILNYFNEFRTEPCNHCDNCKYPPKMIDGTVYAQQALSAIYRLKGQANLDQLIDVLRGAAKKDILAKGFDRIKTYGVGRHTSFLDWKSYLYQLMEIGLIQIAHLDSNKIRVTPLAKKVLFEGQSVSLKKFEKVKERGEIRAKTLENRPSDMVKKLKSWRYKEATSRKVPAYVIFSDKTLMEIANQKPQDLEELSAVEGIGVRKLEQYGPAVLSLVKGEEQPANRYQKTAQLLNRGLSVPEIAQELKEEELTIFSHMAYLIEKGERISLKPYISTAELKEIGTNLKQFETPYNLNELYDFFDGRFKFHQIRLAIGYYKSKLK